MANNRFPGRSTTIVSFRVIGLMPAKGDRKFAHSPRILRVTTIITRQRARDDVIKSFSNAPSTFCKLKGNKFRVFNIDKRLFDSFLCHE